MTSASVCPQCGKSLSADAPQGLCPQCLFNAALPGHSAPTSFPRDDSSSTIAPEAGIRLRYFGDYELLEEIARGGMGVVWKARQVSLNRLVAVKMLRAGVLAGKDEVERFLREAEAAANLQHPHIVAIHEVGEHEGRHYFSMDYVEGQDLGALVRQGPLSAERAARYVKIVAEAIHFAHQRGTLHRDLKPQNVIIDTADQPRVTDFGLAKSLTEDSGLTQSGVVMGSPSYMPPEQAAGQHADLGPAADVYSFGAMLYELLTGRPPFRGATVMATLRLVMEAEPTAPHRLRPDVPPDLETICLKCLEKSIPSRYHSARDLADDLDRFIRGEPIRARPASPTRKAISWARRHPGILAAAAAVLIFGLAFHSIYLLEMNAYLRAKQSDPSLEREPPPSSVLDKFFGGPPWRDGDPDGKPVSRPGHDALLTWDLVNTAIMIIGFVVLVDVFRRARRATWNELFQPESLSRPRSPIGQGAQKFVAGVALVCIATGLLLLFKIIEIQVWEGAVPYMNYLGVFGSVWCGLLLVGALVRDYRLTRHGLASRQLSPEEKEEIRQALEISDYPGAIRLYRKAVPDAGLFESDQNLRRQFPTLCPQIPTATLAPGELNWRALGVCAAIEFVLTGAWLMFAAQVSVGAVYALATGLLFGLGLTAGLRVKGFWKSLFLLCPALALAVSTRAMVPCYLATGVLFGLAFPAALTGRGFWQRVLPFVPMLAMLVFDLAAPLSMDTPAAEIWPGFVGLFFGACLMISAFTRGRKSKASNQPAP